jgi:hypothetical protein
MKIIKYFLDIFYKNKILVFFLFSILSTFNSPFLFLQNFEDLNLYKIIIIYQYVFPVIIFLILLVYLYKLNYYKSFIFDKEYFIIKFLFFLNFIQIFGIFFSNLNYFISIDEITSQPLKEVFLDWKSAFTRMVFVINNFNIILIGFFCQKKKKLKFNLTFLIGFFLIVSLYYCYRIFCEYFSNIDEIINFYASSVLRLGNTTYNFVNPRPTGLARTILLASIFLMMLYLFYKPKFTIQKKLLRYFVVLLIIILNFFIIQLQTRTSSYFLFLIPIFFLIFFYFHKQHKLYFILILFILIPFLLAQFAADYKLFLLKKKMMHEESLNDQKIQLIIQKYSQDANRLTLKSTSGRVDFWRNVIKSYKEIPITGYGVLGDKFRYSVSISNIFLYFLISGGVVGLVSILLFNIYIFKNIFYLLISKKLFTSNSVFLYTSFFFVCFFLFRSIFENSYGQFGIDFIFFVPSCLIFESYLKKFRII